MTFPVQLDRPTETETMRTTLALLTCMLGLAAACASDSSQRTQVSDPAIPPPLHLSTTAYQAAAVFSLPETPPQELPGLHHVYVLSEQIISGAEPVGDEAFLKLQSMGVKTILSVDGKVPDHQTAAKYGIRYVHVPIQYSGITEDERLKIAKTFRELEGPFYTHCYHGKHRGPAGAAIGRIVIDGIPRDEAIAEMRQWAQTSPNYEGLFEVIAVGEIPTASQTRAFAFDFEPEHKFEGVRSGMIPMARNWDHIKDAKKNGWLPDPKHPDVVPLQEAIQLHGLFAGLTELKETKDHPEDFRNWMQQGRDASERLQRSLSLCSQEEDGFAVGDWKAEAEEAYKLLADSCSSCHAVYRD